MREPYTPDGITRNYQATKQRVISDLVGIVNDILTADDSIVLLGSGKHVEVSDSSNFRTWLTLHEEVIEQFRKVGWNVERMPGEEPRYKFRMPE
jgi:hypothetical protein